MSNQNKANSRRKFLLATGVGGAGAAVAVMGGKKIAAGGEAAAAVDKPRGYHVSEHILKYYKTTQV